LLPSIGLSIGLSIAVWSGPLAAQPVTPPSPTTPAPPPAEAAPPAAPPPEATAKEGAPTPPGPKRSLFPKDPVEGPPLPASNAEVLETRDYKEGDPVPPGFRVQRSKRGPLLIAGVMVFGASYVGAALAGFMEQASQTVNAPLRDKNGKPILDENGNVIGIPENYNNSIPMVIPIVGPFLTIESSRSSGARTAVLIALGATQAAGLAMIIAGTLAPPIQLVRYKTGQASFSILPSIGRDGVGVGFVGAL
jgi:hypothetical protein